MKLILLFTIAGCLSCSMVATQSVLEIDTRLAGFMVQISHCAAYDSRNPDISRDDSLAQADQNLINYLKEVCVRYPETIKAHFPKAEAAHLTIVSSDDSKLRLYSWDAELGGTMRYYEDFAQYQSKSGTMICNLKDTAHDGDYGADYGSIEAIHTQDNRTIYLVSAYSVFSTKDRGEFINAYEIANGTLIPASVFHTKTKKLSSIGYGYDMFLSEDKFPKGEIPSIHLSKDKKKLFIPIVGGSTKEEVTDKYLVYVFDGYNFCFDKNAK